MNGWTPSISTTQRWRNECKSVHEMMQQQPDNDYWENAWYRLHNQCPVCNCWSLVVVAYGDTWLAGGEVYDNYEEWLTCTKSGWSEREE